jgi:hypothetical protein
MKHVVFRKQKVSYPKAALNGRIASLLFHPKLKSLNQDLLITIGYWIIDTKELSKEDFISVAFDALNKYLSGEIIIAQEEDEYVIYM